MALDRAPITIGSDPEAFLSIDGAIVGSEKIIPEKGLSYGDTKLTRDGVQVELQFHAAEDWGGIAYSLKHALYYFQEWRKGTPTPGVQFDWTESLDVPLTELMSLSPKSRELLCEPSLNYYDGMVAVDVPTNFPGRSAGGHVHLGLPPPIWNNAIGRYRDERRPLVPMLDFGLGNTLVLLNRGEQQATRRKIYGKSGEFRLPDHGLEYRVPSNFWLRSPLLLQFTFGLAHFIVDVLYTTMRTRKPYDGLLLKDFDIAKVRQAIDTNDYALALENFEYFAEFAEHAGRAHDPLNKTTLPHFRKLLSEDMDEVWPTTGTVGRWINWDPEESVQWGQFMEKF